jgi:hypothetical protein
MTPRQRRVALDVLPLREELEALAHHYHHLQDEHKRAAPESSTRRRIEDELLEVRERFESVLAEWVPDDELREGWRQYLHNRTREPTGLPRFDRWSSRGFPGRQARLSRSPGIATISR